MLTAKEALTLSKKTENGLLDAAISACEQAIKEACNRSATSTEVLLSNCYRISISLRDKLKSFGYDSTTMVEDVWGLKVYINWSNPK